MKTILRSPVFTVVLFILAAALLGFGTVGAVQAAPDFFLQRLGFRHAIRFCQRRSLP